MTSFAGCGVKFYGSVDRGPDGSYVTTKWVTLFYIPLFPLGSYRVIKQDSSISNYGYVISSSTSYGIVTSLGLNILQVIAVYVSLFILAAWAAMFISVAAQIDIDASVPLQIVVISAVVLAPVLSFIYARKGNRSPIGWAIGAFLFPLIPIILTTVVPAKEPS
jgi:hypothetical protein